MLLYNGIIASMPTISSLFYGASHVAQTTREEIFSLTSLIAQVGVIDLTDSDGFVPDSSLQTVFSAYDTVRVTARVTNTTGASLRIREIGVGQSTDNIFTREVVDTTIAKGKTSGFVFKVTYRPAAFVDVGQWVS